MSTIQCKALYIYNNMSETVLANNFMDFRFINLVWLFRGVQAYFKFWEVFFFSRRKNHFYDFFI